MTGGVAAGTGSFIPYDAGLFLLTTLWCIIGVRYNFHAYSMLIDARVAMNPLVFVNKRAAPLPDLEPVDDAPLAFHRCLPGYEPTPLVDAPRLAAELGVGAVLVKDESSRVGLPAFKILGASWAIYRVLDQFVGGFRQWYTLDDLREQLQIHPPLTLVAATDGNHGRGVARMARWLGLNAHILVPADMVEARVAPIEGEGALVTRINGTYDDAVAHSATLADEHTLVISDTAWPGYEEVPRWVIDGYSTIFREIDAQLAQRAEPWPDLVAIQIGVGALAASVVRHFRAPGTAKRVALVGIEPIHAAGVLASMQAGKIVEVQGPHDSIMAGLNCGAPSLVAWPLVSAGIDLFAAIEDDRARQAMRVLAADGIVAGETGAAGAAGLLDLLQGADAAQVREVLGITASTRVLLIATEGATDPAAYAQIVA